MKQRRNSKWSKPFESLKSCLVGLALGTWAFSAASSSQTPTKIVTPGGALSNVAEVVTALARPIYFLGGCNAMLSLFDHFLVGRDSLGGSGADFARRLGGILHLPWQRLACQR